MNIDEIKSKAPSGATHYDNMGDYYRLQDGKWSIYVITADMWANIRDIRLFKREFGMNKLWT